MFNYDAFADAARDFNSKSGLKEKRQPAWRSALRRVVPQPDAPNSRFVDFKGFMFMRALTSPPRNDNAAAGLEASRFYTPQAPAPAPAVPDNVITVQFNKARRAAAPVTVIELPQAANIFTKAATPVKGTLKLKAPAEALRIEVSAESAKVLTAAPVPSVKARGTLKLKVDVTLPPVADISRRSTAFDLASAFKAELKMAAEQVPAAQPVVQKSKSSLQKSWAELAAEAETPKAPAKSMDLAGAFRREMQALLAQQEQALAETPSIKPVPKVRTLAA
jgi:hypothetical protein